MPHEIETRFRIDCLGMEDTGLQAAVEFNRENLKRVPPAKSAQGDIELGGGHAAASALRNRTLRTLLNSMSTMSPSGPKKPKPVSVMARPGCGTWMVRPSIIFTTNGMNGSRCL